MFLHFIFFSFFQDIIQQVYEPCHSLASLSKLLFQNLDRLVCVEITVTALINLDVEQNFFFNFLFLCPCGVQTCG